MPQNIGILPLLLKPLNLPQTLIKLQLRRVLPFQLFQHNISPRGRQHPSIGRVLEIHDIMLQQVIVLDICRMQQELPGHGDFFLLY